MPENAGAVKARSTHARLLPGVRTLETGVPCGIVLEVAAVTMRMIPAWLVSKVAAVTAATLVTLLPNHARAQSDDSGDRKRERRPPRMDTSVETAEELLNRGRNSFAAGNFADSERFFSSFLEHYGASAEAAEALPRLLPLLAISRIQQKKFGEALPVIERFLAEVKNPEPQWDEEMRFWHGVCQMEAQDHEAAEKSLRAFIDAYPKSPKVEEAILLVGTVSSIRGDFKNTVAYFEIMEGRLSPVNRGRATVLRLHALVESQRWDDAMELVMAEFPNVSEMVQIVSFQTLALQVGAEFMDREEFRKAIACLQRVWPRERLLRHQRERLAKLKNQLESASERKAQPFEMLTLAQLITKVERELEQFQKIEQFDPALRLRVGSAYLQMHRYREAALVMEDMLQRMQPDDLVEQASLNVIKCWSQIGSHTRAVEAADAFARTFPKSRQLAMVLFMKGEALRGLRQFAEAGEVFAGIARDHPRASLAPRALFMQGFCQLEAEDNEAAIKTFTSLPKQFDDEEIEEMALYWKGMAYSFHKEHERCRDVMKEYLKRFQGGKYEGEAAFRIAYCAQALGEHDRAIRELRKFLDDHPAHPRRDEAALLLGDALMATGELDKGIIALQNVSDSNTRFFEEAHFKIGKALRLQEKHDLLEKHMARFVEKYPASPRVPEAIYWQGWTYRQADQPDKAREIYWDAIRRLGPDPARRSVTDLFNGLEKLYPGEDGRKAYLGLLEQLETDARNTGQDALTLHALWAQAQVLRRTDPERSRALLVEAAKLVDPPVTSPLLMADIGDALRESGALDQAAAIYSDLRKWNPRAPQKDRAFAGLGLIAVVQGRDADALDAFARFQRETTGSPLLADILLAKARLLAKREHFDEAAAALDALLADETVAKSRKAEALLAMGEIQMQARRPAKAIPYFQRVYVLYGRHAPLVAKSYLRSAQAFEELDRIEEAVATYRELLDRPELADFPETQTARRRLDELTPPNTSANS